MLSPTNSKQPKFRNMIPFAFYGRVSTEDQQDPESSRGWQLHRSRQLIEGHGGVIVAEYFDIGQSRSIPWKRRPEATRLLEDFRSTAREYTAVVIGEPQRAFYGNQFGLTFPVFTHYDVALWVPEVGGPVDPGSEAHDLVMTLFGGMSKGERMRIKTRVRSAMTAQTATEGRFLGGRPPYGYQLVNAGPHPKPDKAAQGMHLRRLDPDPEISQVVQRIFAEFLSGNGYFAIAERLTSEGILSPSGHDRKRNSHRDGLAWGKSAVRAILLNPRYTGYQVWNKQRKDEILLDVEDVAAGHQTVMRWNTENEWVWSNELAHEALISRETFDQAQAIIGSRSHALKERKGRTDARHYALRSRLVCGLCNRKLQGAWNHKEPYYRCRYASEYAATSEIDHPKNVYLREADLLPQLDEWLVETFAHDNIDQLCKQIAEAGDDDTQRLMETEIVKRELASCRQKIERYKSALETGSDVALVMSWIAEQTAKQSGLEAKLRLLNTRPIRISEEEIREGLEEIGGLAMLLSEGDQIKRAEFYAELDLQGTYDPRSSTVDVAFGTRGRMVRVGERT